MKSLVSIVIPCYNHSKYVDETIRSVIEQDYEQVELIVIDDGSTDDSVAVITKLIVLCEDRFVRFEFRSRPNRGLCATLNEALDWCQGEYLCCVASDDILMPDKTSKQVTYLARNPESVGVFGAFKFLGVKSKPKVNFNYKFDFNDILLHKHVLPAPTQLLRLDAVRKVGGFREGFIIEDWSMWLALTEDKGTLDYIGEVFAIYRRHDNNLSGKHEQMHEGRIQILNLYKEHKLYKEALARATLVHIHGIQTENKVMALKEAFLLIRNYPRCIFSKSFFWLAIKMLRV